MKKLLTTLALFSSSAHALPLGASSSFLNRPIFFEAASDEAAFAYAEFRCRENSLTLGAEFTFLRVIDVKKLHPRDEGSAAGYSGVCVFVARPLS